jgi:hypothetical protein
MKKYIAIATILSGMIFAQTKTTVRSCWRFSKATSFHDNGKVNK